MAKREAKKGLEASSKRKPAARHEPDELPHGWAFARLGDIVRLSPEKIEPSEKPDARYVGLEHIETGTRRILGWGSARDVKSTKSVFHAGDILYGKLRPYLNKVAQPDFDGVCSTDVLVLRCESGIEPHLIARLISTPKFVEFAMSNAAGINLPRAKFSNLGDYPLLLAPRAEERRIMSRLDRLERRLREARAALSEVPVFLAQARQAILAAAFEGKLTTNLRARKLKGSQLVRKPMADGSTTWAVPKSWVQTRLENLLCKGGLFDGPFGSKLKTKDYTRSGIRVVRLENIGHLSFDDEKQTFVSSKKHRELKKHTVGEGDIIFSSFIFEPLRVCVLPPLKTKAIAKADCFCIRPDDKLVTRDFLALQLASSNFGQALKELVHGATRPRVNTTQLRITSVAWCPLPEQREIVRRLYAAFERLDATALANVQATAEVDRLEQTILAKAFCGGLVPQNIDDEPAEKLLARIQAERAAAAKAPRLKKFRITIPSKPTMPLLELIRKRFGKKPFTFERLRAEADGRPYDELKQTLFALLRPAADAAPLLTVRFNDEIEAMEFTLRKP